MLQLTGPGLDLLETNFASLTLSLTRMENIAVIMHLDLGKVFDRVPCDIPLHKMVKYELPYLC